MCNQAPLQQLRSYASAARTAAPTLVSHRNAGNYSGVMATIDCTASSATPSVTFAIQTYDEKAADWFTLITSTAVTGAGNTIIGSIAGASAVSDVMAGFHPGKLIRVLPTHADSDSITYSVTIHWVNA